MKKCFYLLSEICRAVTVEVGSGLVVKLLQYLVTLTLPCDTNITL